MPGVRCHKLRFQVSGVRFQSLALRASLEALKPMDWKRPREISSCGTVQRALTPDTRHLIEISNSTK
jgi:hypothetical protein